METKWFCSEESYKNRKAVAKAYPFAAKIVKVCLGWLVFATLSDYEVWKNQK